MFFVYNSYNLNCYINILVMLSSQQIQTIITENESLQVQINDLNYMLEEREREIELITRHNKDDVEMRSLLDIQQEELDLMQNRLGNQIKKSAGAAQRELDLNDELTDTIKLQKEYTNLYKQYNHIKVQLEDIEEELAKTKKRNNMLQQIAVKIGEIESELDNITAERDELKSKVKEFEKNLFKV